jgi:hypothetical protein
MQTRYKIGTVAAAVGLVTLIALSGDNPEQAPEQQQVAETLIYSTIVVPDTISSEPEPVQPEPVINPAPEVVDTPPEPTEQVQPETPSLDYKIHQFEQSGNPDKKIWTLKKDIGGTLVNITIDGNTIDRNDQGGRWNDYVQTGQFNAVNVLAGLTDDEIKDMSIDEALDLLYQTEGTTLIFPDGIKNRPPFKDGYVGLEEPPRVEGPKEYAQRKMEEWKIGGDEYFLNRVQVFPDEPLINLVFGLGIDERLPFPQYLKDEFAALDCKIKEFTEDPSVINRLMEVSIRTDLWLATQDVREESQDGNTGRVTYDNPPFLMEMESRENIIVTSSRPPPYDGRTMPAEIAARSLDGEVAWKYMPTSFYNPGGIEKLTLQVLDIHGVPVLVATTPMFHDASVGIEGAEDAQATPHIDYLTPNGLVAYTSGFGYRHALGSITNPVEYTDLQFNPEKNIVTATVRETTSEGPKTGETSFPSLMSQQEWQDLLKEMNKDK